MLTLAEIEVEVNRLARVIDADPPKLPTYGTTRDFGHQHVEVDAYHYHLVTVERGQELNRVSTKDLDELLYAVFNSVTFMLASDYASAHRKTAEDYRRLLFAHQLQLMNQLSPTWGQWKAEEVKRTLSKHPYNDAAFRGVRLPRHAASQNLLMLVGGGGLAIGAVWMIFHGAEVRDRIAGGAGTVLFGSCAAIGASGLSASGVTETSPRLLRLLPYAPLIAGLLQGPWIIVCVMGLLFALGDKPMSNPQIAQRLFRTSLCIPGAIGLTGAALSLVLHAARTPAQWVCFVIGSALCVAFIAAVAMGWIK